jgi:uncharacterized protein YecE (DUF72 family)
MARLLAGTSGWVYPHWRGVFYPEDLPEDRWFSYFAERFDTVEINNTFYRLPSRQTFENWRDMAPSGFLFTVKASRYITHRKKLKDPEEGLANFYGNLEGMGEACAAVLFQLPPNFGVNLERLEHFLDVMPRRYRIVFEFRHASWLDDDVYSALAKHNAAVCSADSPFHPGPRVSTADFDFFRMHGGHRRGAPKYSDGELDALAGELAQKLDAGRDVFVYFNNDYQGYAIENALALKDAVGARRGGKGA